MLNIFLANGEAHGLPIPLHPFLVNFTAGLVPISMLCDLLGVWLKKPSLLTAGWWTLLAAAVLTPFTAAAGWYWLLSLEHAAHWQLGYHQWLGISFAILLIPLTVWRGLLFKRERSPRWTYAAVAIVFFAALAVQGELGASMSFGRGIVIPAEDATHGHGGATEPDHPTGMQHAGEPVAAPTPPTTTPDRDGVGVHVPATQPSPGAEKGGHEHR